MNRTFVPIEGPKLRLVEAAEKLFAERGFDVVSVRDITQAAGGNVAAVNYHFGSRDGLVEVVMTRYISPVNEERLMRLEAAERKWAGNAVPVEEVVDAFVRPLITQVGKSELSEKLYARLVGRIFGTQCHGMPAEIEAQLVVSIGRFVKVLSKSLPTLAEEDLLWRLHFVIGAMIYMLTHGDALQRLSQGLAGTPSMETTLARFLNFAVAGLRDGVGSPQAAQTVTGDRVSQAHATPSDAREIPTSDGHRPPPQAAAAPALSPVEAVPDDPTSDGHRPPLQVPKKRSKKAEQDSPQVLFEF